MRLEDGTYTTKAGSTVVISGGKAFVEFDWFEERHACIECRVDPYPMWDVHQFVLYWECDHCGGGYAGLSHPKEELEGAE